MTGVTTYDWLFKYLLIGNASTGKSCILHQFVEGKFKGDCAHTIGVEYAARMVSVGDKQIKLQVWDTAGQERFRSVTRSYYRGASGAFLVYDVSRRDTYTAIQTWLQDARTLASPDVTLVLVGNKADLEEEREVTFLEASRFAQENGMLFVETSAVTGDNVIEAFLMVTRAILVKIEQGQMDPEQVGSGIHRGNRNEVSLLDDQQEQQGGQCAC
eukprot:comp26668_c0_seq1/m.47114 comp26668_c0_seq1/g.47114  ORF comp26668_c0_seq1/g.47114 comp26668_c0_seq1/m.47114 type:complete len:214 (-) comp26668_c0_seq1:39-680(-)